VVVHKAVAHLPVLPVPVRAARLPAPRPHRLEPRRPPPVRRPDAAPVHLPAHPLVPRPPAAVGVAAGPSTDRPATAPSRKAFKL